MTKLSPRQCATLADDIYGVQDSFALKGILARPEFSKDPDKKSVLNADRGGRWIKSKSAFGICAKGGKNHENELFVVFRGTTFSNYLADWGSNVRVGLTRSRTGMPVHLGFQQIFNSLLPQLEDFLKDNVNVSGPIHCIGHSLGGAIATLAADWLRSRGRQAQLYTFGAPRIGTERFARELTLKLRPTNIHRVYHTKDVVPMIPVYPFIHCPNPGPGYHLPGSAHEILRYVESVGTTSWGALARPAPPFLVDAQVEHWLKSESPANGADNNVWNWINSALAWIVKRFLGAAAAVLQSPFLVGFTLADRLAWLLERGIVAFKEAGQWVLRLMQKICQALGMALVESTEALTRALMRQVLERLISRLTLEAERAIRKLLS